MRLAFRTTGSPLPSSKSRFLHSLIYLSSLATPFLGWRDTNKGIWLSPQAHKIAISRDGVSPSAEKTVKPLYTADGAWSRTLLPILRPVAQEIQGLIPAGMPGCVRDALPKRGEKTGR